MAQKSAWLSEVERKGGGERSEMGVRVTVEGSEMGNSDGGDYGGGEGGEVGGPNAFPPEKSSDIDAKKPLVPPSGDSAPLDEEDPSKFTASKVNTTLIATCD